MVKLSNIKFKFILPVIYLILMLLVWIESKVNLFSLFNNCMPDAPLDCIYSDEMMLILSTGGFILALFLQSIIPTFVNSLIAINVENFFIISSVVAYFFIGLLIDIIINTIEHILNSREK